MFERQIEKFSSRERDRLFFSNLSAGLLGGGEYPPLAGEGFFNSD
jgi:hypothetical protein